MYFRINAIAMAMRRSWEGKCAADGQGSFASLNAWALSLEYVR